MTTQTRPQILRVLLDKVAEMGERESIPINTAVERDLFQTHHKKFAKAVGKEWWVMMDIQDDRDEVGYPDGNDCAIMKFKKISKAQIRKNAKKSAEDSARMWKEHAEFEADYAVGGKYYDKEES